MEVGEIKRACTNLKGFWRARNKKFEEWMDLLTLEDTLAQEDMESVVSNNPRTLYNMSRHILTPKAVVFRIPIENLTKEQQVKTNALERHLNYCWGEQNKLYRRRGKGSWFNEFISLLLITGWYSVFALVTQDSTIAEIWNPAQSFPKFGDAGLEEHAHIFELTEKEANRLVRSKDWIQPPLPLTGKQIVYDYWVLNEDGIPCNAVAIGQHGAKPLTQHPEFLNIPILTAPAGGFADRGGIATGDTWKEYIGQGVLATNERSFLDHNKLSSFVQQLIRDTAQSRWVEKTRGQGVLTPEKLRKRGGIFRIGPEDDIYALPVPSIPPELYQQLMTKEAEIQRGGLPHILFGTLMREVSGYTMSQIAESAHQVLGPYHQAMLDAMTDVSNFWLQQERQHNLHPYKFTWPPKVPENIEVEAVHKMPIPGDLVQRATTARMLSPSIEFSPATTMDIMFPEIPDPEQEIDRAGAAKAMEHPVVVAINLVRGLEEQAAYFTEMGDIKGAQLFKRAAEMVRNQMEQQQQQGPPGQAAPGIRPEVMPAGGPTRPME